MPSEALKINPQPLYPSLESLKETFRKRLDAIIYKPLTIENIETFADEALEETIKLTDDILTEYRKNPNFKASPTTLNTQEQENEAFAILGLSNIQEILQLIINVKEKIDSLKTYINTNVENIDEIITPPQSDHITEIVPGDKSFERKKIFPRLLTFLYIIEHDFEITPTLENVLIKEGIVTPKMMRKTPYARVEIPELDRVVYICNEEGNASYVFDTKKLSEAKLTLKEIDLDDKGDKNSLIAYHPGIGIRIIQSTNWRDCIRKYLEEEIPQVQTGVPEKHEGEERERLSEFRERPHWLPFEEFQNEVRKFYPGKGDVKDWYHEEQKNHPDWPSAPYSVYKKGGWQGWPELVGIENRLKKEFIPFIDFQKEVRTLYKGKKGGVQGWYRKEKEKHLNWPSNPNVMYKYDGWIGFPELVEKENHLKRKFLPFIDFQKEVRTLFPFEQKNVQTWYHQKQKEHPNWPASPDKIYKNKGWMDWSELVGKENPSKKEFLSFDSFQTEVGNLYSGQGGIEKWYHEERKNHPDWPSGPNNTYKDKGWINWLELVRKKIV